MMRIASERCITGWCRKSVAHHQQASCMLMTAEARVTTTARSGGATPSAALWDPGTGRKCCESDACCAADSWRAKVHPHQCPRFEGGRYGGTCVYLKRRNPNQKSSDEETERNQQPNDTPNWSDVSTFRVRGMHALRTYLARGSNRRFPRMHRRRIH